MVEKDRLGGLPRGQGPGAPESLSIERKVPAGGRSLARRAAWILLLFPCLLAALCLFEVCYRWQIFDSYRPELRSWNDPADLDRDDGRPTLLAMGDSFTAGVDSYPSRLRPLLPEVRVINGGLSGTGILEAGLAAPGWFRRFHPTYFVYQIFVGNDLFNLRYPHGREGVSMGRWLYWRVAERLWGVGFLNYRTAQLIASWRQRGERPSPPPENDPGPFNPDRYNMHERLYIHSDPWFLDDQINLEGSRKRDFEELERRLGDLLALCSEPACHAVVLVIPHACQVHRRYADNLAMLGARFRGPDVAAQEVVPFTAGLADFLERQGPGADRLIDVLGALRTHEADGDTMYYLHDPHLNMRGQQLVTEMVRARLMRFMEPAGMPPRP
jgi:hypothetical protein